MIVGYVNANYEAVIRFVVANQASNQRKVIDAVIDTGFTGFLSLPSSIIQELNLPWSYRDRGTLGDGSEVIFDIYLATAIWDGELKTIKIIPEWISKSKIHNSIFFVMHKLHNCIKKYN